MDRSHVLFALGIFGLALILGSGLLTNCRFEFGINTSNSNRHGPPISDPE